MALNLPVDQVSVRGVRTANVAGVTLKPTSFQYQPTTLQKRVESFDANGFRTPGVPIPISKDPKFSVGYSVVSGPLIALVTSDYDTYYSASIAFATTDDGTFNFAATGCIVDGQSVNIDPLADTMQITYFIDLSSGSVSFA